MHICSAFHYCCAAITQSAFVSLTLNSMAADVLQMWRISVYDCMLGADAACLEVNSLIQETSYVSSTKDRAGEYGHCLMYLLSVLTSSTPQTYVVSIKMLSKTMHFVLKVSVNKAAFEQIHPFYDTGI